MNLHNHFKILFTAALASQMAGCSDSSSPTGSLDVNSSTLNGSSGTNLSEENQGGSSGQIPLDSSSGPLGGTSSGASSGITNTSSSNSGPATLGTAPTIRILPWNGAKGAYSLIMDDFGAWGANGTHASTPLIWADSVAHLRQLPIAFAIVTGDCQPDEWAAAKIMMQHGSEPVNHSATHSQTEDPTASTNTIEAELGYRPTFYGYPYDVSTPAIQATLKTLGYIGSRSSNVDTSWPFKQFNAATHTDGFTIVFDARRPPPAGTYFYADKMDAYADSAVSRGEWAFRETHGIADGSYGEWTSKTEFLNHMNHLASLRDKGDLWVSTPSTILRYINLSIQATWKMVTKADAHELQWTIPTDTLGRYSVPLRLEVCGEWSATQGSTNLNATISAGQTKFSANPSLGTVKLTPTGAGNSMCTTPSESSSSGGIAQSSNSSGANPLSLTETKQEIAAGTYSVTTSCATMLQFTPPTGSNNIHVTINGVAHTGLYSLQVPPPGTTFAMVVTGGAGVLCW
jgi:hypothetical protein